MKILANENVPLASVDKLSEAGFDIVSLSRLSPGIDDASVLQLARDQRRVLITFDRDYGKHIVVGYFERQLQSELVIRHRPQLTLK